METKIFIRRMLRNSIACLLIASVLLLCTEDLQAQNSSTEQKKSEYPEHPKHPLAPALKIARASRKVVADIRDYEAILTKREKIRNRLISTQMQIRLREKPFSVYLKFIQPNAGREILYVQGQNNNKMMAHEGSGFSALIGTVSLPTNGPDAMKENRYPITSIGISNLLELVIKQWEYESQFGEIDVLYYPNASIGKVKCQVIEVTHPQPRKEFKYQKTRLFLEKETKVPIRVENYAFPKRSGQPPELVEEYTYTNIRTNVGLADLDFSSRNPKYKF